MRKKLSRILLILLAVSMLMQIPALASAGFSDVPDGEWYVNDVAKAVGEGILHGDPGGTFRPKDYLTYGEFYTVMVNCLNRCYGYEYDAPPAQTGHWARPYCTILRNLGALRNISADDSDETLNTYITRYEAALVIYNCLFQLGTERISLIGEPEKIFRDYDAMSVRYRFAVTQLYAKGAVSGYPDGYFHGEDPIVRCEIANLICRFIWNSERAAVDQSIFYTPAAIQWQRNGWIDGWGNANPELCMQLTGREDRPYFYSWDEAAPYMTDITVPVWNINGSGVKYTAYRTLTVNKAVERDVRAIFEMIYNDPEQFPITDVGCARFSDTMRHAWGCAIDINPNYNAECRAYYDKDMNTIYAIQTCGMGWWPVGTERTALAGSLSQASALSIPRGGSVEKAFRTYGWGWGGNGWSVRNEYASDNPNVKYSQGFDLMHFSVMSSGG